MSLVYWFCGRGLLHFDLLFSKVIHLVFSKLFTKKNFETLYIFRFQNFAFIENMAYRDHGYQEHDFDNFRDCVLENYMCSRKQVHIENLLYKKFRSNSGDPFSSFR